MARFLKIDRVSPRWERSTGKTDERKGESDRHMKTTQTSAPSRIWIEITWESMVITLICALDLLSTVWLLEAGRATEANPLMAYLLNHSLSLFCGVKMGTVACLVTLAEWYRKYNPVFVRKTMRWTIIGYIVIYFVLVSKINLA
jgi:hypothetical protein